MLIMGRIKGEGEEEEGENKKKRKRKTKRNWSLDELDLIDHTTLTATCGGEVMSSRGNLPLARSLVHEYVIGVQR